MKLSDDVLCKIDEIYDPANRLDGIPQVSKPKIALDITPTSQHAPCHDLFRVYTFCLLRDLSKFFELIVIYRDIQATIELPLEEAKRLIQENISLLRSSMVPFQVYYESEILQKHLVDMPETFFSELYRSILHKNHNHFTKPLVYSSTSMAVLIPLLKVMKIGFLLCMHDEKENVKLLKKIYGPSANDLPIILYRSFPDMQNKKHGACDEKRIFPYVKNCKNDILTNFKRYGTNIHTIREWYKKLGMLNKRVFNYNNKSMSASDIFYNLKTKNIGPETALELFASHLSGFLNKEGIFVGLSSKEVRLGLTDPQSKKVLDCLNIPTRVNIIKLLNKENLPASKISKQVNVSLPTTLFHLSKLQETGIISRDKNKVYCLNTNRFTLYM